MNRIRRAVAGFVVLSCVGVTTSHAQQAQAPSPVAAVAITTPVKLAAPARPVKSGATSVYIVKLKDAGAASYGNASIYSAGRAVTQNASAQRASRAAFAERLEQTHDRLLADVGAPSAAKIYSYRYALNGFAAKLTAAEASRLAQQPEVARVWLDSDRHVDTNNSSMFLGLEDGSAGLHAGLKLLGENVVVGVVDTGLAPNHPSLLDTVDLIPRGCRGTWAKSTFLGLMLCSSYRRHPLQQVVYNAPVGFSGTCQAGPGFEAKYCNNKVVGARFYVDGFLARHKLKQSEESSDERPN